MKKDYILWYEEIGKKDLSLVGGKNASLGEMTRGLKERGINLPEGFAITTKAYWAYLEHNKLSEKLSQLLSDIDVSNVSQVQKIGKRARALILQGEYPRELQESILKAYESLSSRVGRRNLEVAVRSSGVAEDAPTDSFAGQFETFLNIRGKTQVLEAVKKCFASAFNDRVIVYRAQKGIDQISFALSVGVQQMIRSDLASSGVMFTLDTDTGFDKVVLITAIWGVGEMIVKGHVTPDEYYVFKPTLAQGFRAILRKDLGKKEYKYVFSPKGGLREVKVPLKDRRRFALSDEEILQLADWAVKIEEFYGGHQDIEWAKDGKNKKLYIVQARPETVFSTQKRTSFVEYKLETTANPVLEGIAVGRKIGQGRVRVILDVKELRTFKKGEVLVTRMTDPDWVSAFPLAAAIITDEGGTTSHAAIVAREFGVPAIVGTGQATKVLKTGQIVTVDCSQGKRGRVFLGKLPYETKEYEIKEFQELPVKIMVNIGSPEIAFSLYNLPVQGVGLARQEFIVANKIRVHPLALYYFEKLQKGDKAFCKKWGIKTQEAKSVARKIEEATVEHKDKKEFYVKELAEGIGQIAAAFWPKEVILRLSDFKSNEYRNLIGGEIFERHEENPMLGFRGASRYTDAEFLPAFQLECLAIRRVREEMGLKNLSLMVPFCRTPEEGAKVLELLEEFGVYNRNEGERPKIYVMAELPSNFLLAEDFLNLFDGMSIGSNDLTQLVFGLDRDNALISHIANENHPALKKAVSEIIKACRKRKKYVGICGEAPSNYPEFALFLVKEGIDSISLNPESVLRTYLFLQKELSG